MSLSSSSLSSQSFRNRLLETQNVSLKQLHLQSAFYTSNTDPHRPDADQYYDADPDMNTTFNFDADLLNRIRLIKMMGIWIHSIFKGTVA
jgi:hypothetical protein